MAQKYRIKPIEVSKDSKYIKPGLVEKDSQVSFNFKRLCSKGKKFNYTDKDPRYFIKLIERLKNICTMTRQEMTTTNRNSLRCHQLRFIHDNLSETTFGLGEDVDDDAWQFQISSNEHGRIHGYFIGNIFYIVWLDPNHELYPGA